jgi:hypothetical protein
MIKQAIAAALTVAALGVALPSYSATVIVRTAPPPPRQEAVPEARRGYVWRAGHWDWRGNKHVWVKGQWVKARRGYHYVQPTWVEDNGRWRMSRGAWRRGDADGDGVRNKDDRRPNNPNRS